MEKPAETHYPIHDLLRQRWSPRAFSDRAVSHDVLCSLMEAARWAPSSSNEQPWHFLIATKETAVEYDRLLSCLNDSNQVWARLAPVLAISIAHTVFADGGETNRHAFHDVGLCVENLVIEATSVELMVHQMQAFPLTKFENCSNFQPTARRWRRWRSATPGFLAVTRSPASTGILPEIPETNHRFCLYGTVGTPLTDCDESHWQRNPVKRIVFGKGVRP